MNGHLNRAALLMQQSRHELAEKELRQALAEDPDDALAHAFLAQCLGHRERYDEATREAKEAIHLAPDMAYTHYVLATVLDSRDDLAGAESAVEEAVRLDPADADFRGLQAGIRYQQRDWSGALAAAEEGLALDAEHVGCTNLRAMALVKLGRRSEAGTTLDAALAHDPENAITHANQGWALLEQNDPQKAMEHFREALRLEPELEWARAGIVEAMKAKYLVYRLMLLYFLWMAKLGQGAQWAVVIGGYFGIRVLNGMADNNPALRPWVLPIIVIYTVFAVMTWIAVPLFNLLLRLNRFGRLALSREQIVASNWFGACLAAALLALGWWLVTQQFEALLLALIFGLLTLPVSATFKCASGWPRTAMAVYTGLMALAGLGGFGLLYAATYVLGKNAADAAAANGHMLLRGFTLAAILSPWVANALLVARPRR